MANASCDTFGSGLVVKNLAGINQSASSAPIGLFTIE